MSGLQYTSYTSNIPSYTTTLTTLYQNYINFFNNPGTVTKTGSIMTLQINSSGTENPTIESLGGTTIGINFFGYFCPTQSGDWTFNVATQGYNPDDAAILFLGPPKSTITPNSTYTSSSTTPSSTLPIIFTDYRTNPTTKTVTGLVTGQFYPILMYYVQTAGGYAIGLSFQPGSGTGTYITNFAGYIFTLNIISTNLFINNVDAITYLIPYTSGPKLQSRYYIDNVDLGDLFTMTSYGDSALTTKINVNGLDIRNLLVQKYAATTTGTISTTTYNGYIVVSFTSGTGTIQFPKPTTCQVLIVGGGGGGGFSRGLEGGGGGGGGGVGVGTLNFLSSSTYTVTVGTGGAGGIGASSYTVAANGTNSTISGSGISETANGGGGGGNGITSVNAGLSGGSGGGINGYGSTNPSPGAATIGSGDLTYYGNSGGVKFTTSGNSGGGGATSTGTGTNANGGNGYIWDTVTGLVYGGGGGGGGLGSTSGSAGSSGGTGGGGAGGTGSTTGVGTTGTTASTNTGGGGGGGGGNKQIVTTGTTGGAGGSGIVIIAYKSESPYITTFELLFSSSLTQVDSYDNRLTYNSTVTRQTDLVRYLVGYMSASNVSISTNYATASTFTRTFWYKPTSITANANNTLSSSNVRINFNSNSYLTATFNVVSGVNATISDTTNRDTGTWTHYALSYDISTATAILYVNGSQVSTQSPIYYYGEPHTANAGGLCIGDYNATSVGGQAYFDYVRSFNYALTSSQILNIYNNELGLVISGLTNYYNFRDTSSYSGSGTTVTNLINSSADMELKNTP